MRCFPSFILHGYHIQLLGVDRSMHSQLSDKITTWFHTRSFNYSPALVVNNVQRKFLNMCKHRNMNLSVSPEQLRDSLSEATCTMYLAKRSNRDWAGPHRAFPYPSGWSNDYERIWEEMLESFVFTTEFWECFWVSLQTDACEIHIPSWRSNMEIILPKYILREMEVLKSNGMILDQKILYTDENTHEPVYENEEEEY